MRQFLIAATVSSAQLKYLLIAVGICGALLLLGFFLRSKVKLFQKLFLPASVIGGFIGLFLGGQLLGKWWPGYYNFINLKWLGLTAIDDVNTIFSSIPTVLIIPIFAATLLGNFGKKKTKEERAAARAKGQNLIGPGLFFMLMGMMTIQATIGYIVNLVATKAGAELYSQWGYELAIGFVGGHSTAASISAFYGTAFNTVYGAETGAQMISASTAVGVTFATVGLIGGIAFGILFINIAARKGKTALMKEPVKLEGTQVTGIEKDITKQEVVGRQTVKSFAVESIAVHVAIIAFDCVLAYFTVKCLGKLPGKWGIVLGQTPVWSLAMVYMFGINALLKALKLEWLIDKKLVGRIAGSLTDIAIVCAIASMNLKAVATYWLPILICCVIGFVATYFYIFKFTKAIVKDEAPFEHSIIAWGACTGVLMTGLVLLKICDPNYETKALGNFTKSFAIMSVSQVLLLLIYTTFWGKGTLALFGLNGILALIFTAAIVVIIIIDRVGAKKRAKAAAAA